MVQGKGYHIIDMFLRQLVTHSCEYKPRAAVVVLPIDEA